jgi:effector-binding domain-containing protein
MAAELLTIGTLSMLTRLTPKTLRYYEEKGLLVPSKKEITGYRIYSYEHVARGLLLNRLSGLGFGIQEMRAIIDVIDGRADRSSVGPIIAAKVVETRKRVEELERIREVLEKTDVERLIDMSQEIPKMVEVAPIRIASKRGKGAWGEVVPRLMDEVYSAVSSQPQARISGPPMSICHDQEYKETDQDIEVCVPVTGRVVVVDDLAVRTLEGGLVVSAIHKGPYDTVGEAWGRVLKFAQENGLKRNGPDREIYLNDPTNLPVSEVLTEVQLPVERPPAP